MREKSGISERATPSYIKFLSMYDKSQWSRLDQSVIECMCHPKSLLEYWDDIINDRCCAVEKAFLIDKDGNVEGFYHRRLFSSVVEVLKSQRS